MRSLLVISMLFMWLSVQSQKVFDRRNYNLVGKVEPTTVDRPLLQFQVRFSAVALMNDRSPVYYRLRLLLPLKKAAKVRAFVVKGDSLYSAAMVTTNNTMSKRSRISRLWIYKAAIHFPRHGFSIYYSQSLVRGKVEIRRMPANFQQVSGLMMPNFSRHLQ